MSGERSPATSAAELIAAAGRCSAQGDFKQAVQLLQKAFTDDPTTAAGHRAYTADVIRRGADPGNLAKLGPYRLNTLIHTGWLHSLITSRPVNSNDQPIPWFTYPAIDFLEPRVGPNWSVLEWGAGNSTLWWAKRARWVISIEHDPAWHQMISASAPVNSTISLATNETDYVSATDSPERFDVIVIDGEHRNSCARRAVELAGPQTIIIFDNSDRQAVRDGLHFLDQSGWKRIDFFGLLPAYCYRTCTTVFFKDDAILKGPLACDSRSSLGPTCAQVLGE
jgi:hypothetical protein